MKIKAWVLYMFFILPLGYGAEHWDVYMPSDVPWEAAESLAAFNGTLFVSGFKANNLPGLWKQEPDNSWSEINGVPGFSGKYIDILAVHQGNIYGFEVDKDTSTVQRQVIRSNNGTNWVVDSNAFPVGKWGDVIQFGNYIYASGQDGTVWRSLGAGTAWTENTRFQLPDASDRYVFFATYTNTLIGMVNEDSGPILTNNGFITQDGTWQDAIRTWSYRDKFHSGAVEFNGSLYWAANYLERVTDLNFYWQRESVGVLPVPFVLGNQLHVYGPTGQIYIRSEEGTWSSVFENTQSLCATDASKASRATYIGDSIYILPCALMRYRIGAFDLLADNAVPATMNRGERSVEVLTWVAQINSSDTLTELTVQNDGTAVAGTDISQLRLFIRSKYGGTDKEVAQLVPQPGGLIWKTPTSLSFQVVDGDKFFLAADFADANSDVIPICRFQILTNGVKWERRTDFQLSTPLVATRTQSIWPNPLASSITDIKVAPQPVKDSARFYYQLTSVSSVKLEVFDQVGRSIGLVNDPNKIASPTAHTDWSTGGVPSGIYYAVITISPAGGGTNVMKKKFVIEK